MKGKLLMMMFLLACPMALLADDDPESAGLLKANGSVGGTMDFEHHIDWYKFELPEDGSITLTATPSAGLDLSDISVSAKPEESYYTRATASCAERQVLVISEDAYKAGTYWVKVSRRYSIWDKKIGGEGSYTLRLDFNHNPHPNDAEPNDTWDQATRKLTPGETVYGHIGYFYSGNSDIDKEDWYMIEVPSDGKVTLKATPLGTTFIASLELLQKYDPNDESDYNIRHRMTVTTDKLETVEGSQIDCKPGTYWVRLYMNYSMWAYTGCGSYEFTYDFTPDPLENDAEPNDTWDQATLTIANGETVTGHLGYYLWGNEEVDRTDWYKIEVPEYGEVKLEATPHAIPWAESVEGQDDGVMYLGTLALFTPNGDYTDCALRNELSNGERGKTLTLTVTDCKPGTYYVRLMQHFNMWIYNGCGSYTLNYKFSPAISDREPNDTHENAETIESGWNISGLLGYYYWSYYSGKQDIDTDDWYRLIITEPCVLTIDAAIETYIPTNVPLNAGFSVLKEADMEHELGRINIDRDKEWTALTIDAKEPDTYFIHVWRAVNIWADMGHGGYILYVDSSAASSIQAIGQDTDDNWIIRDLGGKQVASGRGALSQLQLAPGVYILHQGKMAKKFVVSQRGQSPL